jgi:hypothetical protein
LENRREREKERCEVLKKDCWEIRKKRGFAASV